MNDRMKKGYIALGVLAVFLLGGIFGYFGVSRIESGMMLTEGNIVFSKNGQAILLGKKGPVVLSDQSRRGKLFENIEEGDGVKVILGAIEGSYPAHGGAYFLFKSRDPIDSEDEEQIKTLIEYGWLDNPLF